MTSIELSDITVIEAGKKVPSEAVIVSNVSFAYLTVKSLSEKLINHNRRKSFQKLESLPSLQNTSLKASKGQIYGLLGPSGCGKTTLLKCILGRLKPSNGVIKVFGSAPTPGTHLGYMPQDVALFDEFSVEQTLQYFGRLAGLKEPFLAKRIDFLIDLLYLTSDLRGRLVRKLSGGQKRRLSLAAAVIHQPPLLILDEATVGVDPVLRADIWRYLRRICDQQGVTIILTTHYVEEVREADVVGFMRNGQLLVEGSPESLLEAYKTKSLSDVFLKVSEAQETQTIPKLRNAARDPTRDPAGAPIENLGKDLNRILELSPNFIVKPNKTFDTSRCLTIFWKNMSKIRRHPFAVVFYLLMPALHGWLFCSYLVQNPRNLPVAIINQEDPAWLSDVFISMLDKKLMSPLTLKDAAEAQEQLKSGSLAAYITFRQNFSEAILERYSYLDVEAKIVTDSQIFVRIDFSNRVYGIAIYRSIWGTFRKFLSKLASENGWRGVSMPIQAERFVYGSAYRYSVQGWTAGLLLGIMLVPPLFMSLYITVSERQDRLLDRSLVVGVTGLEVIAAISLTQLLMLTVPVVLLMVIVFGVFGISCEGAFVHVFLLLYLQGVAGAAYAILLSACLNNFVHCMMFGMGWICSAWFTSGMVWPREAIPYYVRPLGHIFSMTIPTTALSNVICRGWGLEHFEVTVGYISTTAFIFFYLTIGVFCFKKFTNS